ncbi:hypothetical protein [Legionella drozanskii]|uniref:SEC-C motif domain protein n=1 Tax=Legionella drozanskii LLAP-1 TaxID=1212489 RepID=A0A0W0SMF8_9GAMM|nr:hypothetical protein [Legionella drozanskii]KTC84515.1 hypothetical protein Ldro_2679 [Legionella drozanskii LLAP-1]
MIWWKSSPLLFEQFKAQLIDFFYLKLDVENEDIILHGEWPVHGATKLIKKYNIKVIIPNDYPYTIPKVFELSNQIPKTQDRHFNPQDESACLFVKPERWVRWPIGSGIDVFLNGVVKEFFFSQAYYDLKGKWPFGEWAHGNEGIVQYFLTQLNLKNVLCLYDFFQYINSTKPTRSVLCPCRNGKRFRRCHWDKFSALRDRLPKSEWVELSQILMLQLKPLIKIL